MTDFMKSLFIYPMIARDFQDVWFIILICKVWVATLLCKKVKRTLYNEMGSFRRGLFSKRALF